jgi:hypothetical protein
MLACGFHPGEAGVMIIEEAIATFLRVQSPDEFCHTCVSRRLEIGFADAAAALKRLRVVPGFEIEPGRCVRCGRLRLVARFTPPSGPESETATALSGADEPCAIRPLPPPRCAVCGFTIAEIEATVRVPDDRVAHRRCVIAFGARDEAFVSHRLIIVRAGAVDVYDKLHGTYGSEAGTRIVYDRRVAAAGARSPGDRRFPQDPGILASRGFFVTRPRPVRLRA